MLEAVPLSPTDKAKHHITSMSFIIEVKYHCRHQNHNHSHNCFHFQSISFFITIIVIFCFPTPIFLTKQIFWMACPESTFNINILILQGGEHGGP